MDTWDRQNDYWNQHLERLADEVKLNAGLIWDSRNQLITVFGETWLRNEYERLSKAGAMADRGIVGVLSNPIVNNAVEIVELAKYLREFSRQNNFGEIITKLKNAPEYKAIRLNLAYGFRMKRSGCTDVFVEPKIGDIEATYEGVEYVVECSMIEPPLNASNFAEQLRIGLMRLIDKNSGPKACIKISFNKIPTSADIREVLSLARSTYYEYLKTKKSCVKSSELVGVEVKDATLSGLRYIGKDMEKRNIDFAYKLASHPPKIPGDIYSVDLDDNEKVIDQGMIEISGLIGAQKSTKERLLIKLKNKKKQTKGIPSNKRRIFVFMAKGMVDDEDIHDIGNSLAESIKHEDKIDDIAFVDRRHQTYQDKLRYPSAQIHFFPNRFRVKHLENLVRDMKSFEHSDWIEK